MHRAFVSLLIAVGTTLLFFTVTVADFSSPDWQYFKSLSLPTNVGVDDPLSLVLDEDVYVHAADGLADLRLISTSGVETPYLLESLRGRVIRTTTPLQVIDRGYVASAHSQMTLDFGSSAIRHNVIELGAPSLTELWREVEIEVSQDNISWSSIGSDEIYRVVRGSTVIDSYVLQYPTSSSRYLRIKFIDDGTGDLQMGSAIGFREEAVLPALITSNPASMNQVDDTTERTSTIDFDLGRSGMPFHNVELRTSDRNFNRRVAIQVSDDQEKWVTLSSRTEIFSYTVGLNPLDSLNIQVPESTNRYIRLTLFNEDNPPISIAGSVFEGYQKRLVFLADSSEGYSLFYGNKEGSAPVYDAGVVIGDRVEPANLFSVTAGVHNDNVGYVEPPEPLTERLPWLVPLLVGFIAIIVGGLLYTVFRKARSIVPPREQ